MELRCKFIQYTPSLAAEKTRTPIVPDLQLKHIGTPKTDNLFNLMEREKLILFLFSTDCHHCDDVSETWNDIFDQYRDSYTIVGVSPHGEALLKDYILRNDARFPVYQCDKLEAYGFFSFPQTIIADKTGRITSTVKGNEGELKKLFKLKEGK